jgi:hypothetical protein
MPAKIVIAKFQALGKFPTWEKFEKQNFQVQKNLCFKGRFLKADSTVCINRLEFKNKSSFKRNWFCKSCFNIFRLKPGKRYKTLMHYRLNCSCCKSVNIIQHPEITKAINCNIPVLDIARLLKDENWDIEIPLTAKNKYYPTFIGVK